MAFIRQYPVLLTVAGLLCTGLIYAYFFSSNHTSIIMTTKGSDKMNSELHLHTGIPSVPKENPGTTSRFVQASVASEDTNTMVGEPSDSREGSRDDALFARRQRILELAGFEEMVSNNVAEDDPKLLNLVRELLDPPSTRGMTIPRPLYDTPQSKEIQKLFEKSSDKFYVEVGGLDGERSSNTIILENKLGWNGLLIEADSYLYTQLLGKNRKAWSINACLSPVNKTQMLRFNPIGGGGHVVQKTFKPKAGSKSLIITVPCFTLRTLLLAMDMTHIDYFSLDVEGIELDVLKTIDYGKINISVITVEYVHVAGGKEGIKQFLQGQGYRFLKQIDVDKPEIHLWAHDLLFQKP